MQSRSLWKLLWLAATLGLVAGAGACFPGDFDALTNGKDDPANLPDDAGEEPDGSSGTGSTEGGKDQATGGESLASGGNTPGQSNSGGMQSGGSGTVSTVDCAGSYTDCDGDPTNGPEGDGCETDVRGSLEHCSECGLACATSPLTVTHCQASQCRQHAFTVAMQATGPVHGYQEGGSPFGGSELRCPKDQVLVGVYAVHAITHEGYSVLYLASPTCAAVQVSEVDTDSFTFEIQEAAVQPVTTGALPSTGEYSIDSTVCPVNTLATRLQVLLVPVVLGNGIETTAAAGFILDCHGLVQDPKTGQPVLSATGSVVELRTLSVLDTDPELEDATERCPLPMLTGIAGRSGGWIDALGAQCGQPALVVNEGLTVPSP